LAGHPGRDRPGVKARTSARIIVVSAARWDRTSPPPAHPKPPKHDPATVLHCGTCSVPLIRAALRKHLGRPRADGGRAFARADWTDHLPPPPRGLTNGHVTGPYRNGRTDRICGADAVIHRAEVAHLSCCACSATARRFSETIGIRSLEEGDTDGGQQEGRIVHWTTTGIVRAVMSSASSLSTSARRLSLPEAGSYTSGCALFQGGETPRSSAVWRSWWRAPGEGQGVRLLGSGYLLDLGQASPPLVGDARTQRPLRPRYAVSLFSLLAVSYSTSTGCGSGGNGTQRA